MPGIRIWFKYSLYPSVIYLFYLPSVSYRIWQEEPASVTNSYDVGCGAVLYRQVGKLQVSRRSTHALEQINGKRGDRYRCHGFDDQGTVDFNA